jgi:tetratricopeptide (TPR) repeat protein
MLSKNPAAVYDSLKKFDDYKLSSENEAYFELLITIAKDKNDIQFVSDSIISSSVKWYEESRDYYNYARALTYNGIVRYTLDPKDTLSFDLFKGAEQLFQKHKLKDNHILGMIYAYLGKINKADKNFGEAELYFKKSADINKLSGNNFNYILSLLDIIWTKINLKDYHNIPELINTIDKVADIPEVLNSNIYNVKSTYYASISNYKKAIEFAKLNLKYSKNFKSRDNQYYALSAFYYKLNILDSAIVYAEKAVWAVSDTVASSNYHLYKHLADLYKLKGRYESASDIYYKAYEFHQKYLNEVSSKRILELEKRYDVSMKDAEIAKERDAKRFLMLLLLLSIVLVSVLFFLLRLRMKLLTKEKQIASVNMEKLQKTELIKETLNATTGLLSQFTDEVYRITVRSAKNSGTEIDEINNAITNIKKSFRKRLSAITTSQAFIESYPLLGNLEEFTDQERLIIVLLQQGNSASFIAKILNSTPSSIRGNKSYIRKKIASSAVISDENKKNLLEILDQDNSGPR